MNSRFEDLEKQCWSHHIDGVLIDGHLHFDTKKFGELIVRECAKAADEGLAQVTMKVEWPSYHIKKHFGVEE